MSAEQIVWCCDVCGDAVADNAGYINVGMTQVRACEEARAEWKAAHPGTQFLTIDELAKAYPEARWQVQHRACDPRPASGDYWIGVERVRTSADLLARTAHLLEKSWLAVTDWPSIIRRPQQIGSAS